jgi:hypothetical protein
MSVLISWRSSWSYRSASPCPQTAPAMDQSGNDWSFCIYWWQCMKWYHASSNLGHIPNAFNSIPDLTRAITVTSFEKYLNLSPIRILLAWITIFFCCLSSYRLQSLMLEFYCVSTKLYFKPLSPEEKEKKSTEQFQVIRIVQISNPWKSVCQPGVFLGGCQSFGSMFENSDKHLIPCLRILTSFWFSAGVRNYLWKFQWWLQVLK